AIQIALRARGSLATTECKPACPSADSGCARSTPGIETAAIVHRAACDREVQARAIARNRTLRNPGMAFGHVSTGATRLSTGWSIAAIWARTGRTGEARRRVPQATVQPASMRSSDRIPAWFHKTEETAVHPPRYTHR